MQGEVKKVKFKVRDLGTGLYQDGKIEKCTGEPTWSKKGKIWRDLVELKKNGRNVFNGINGRIDADEGIT